MHTHKAVEERGLYLEIWERVEGEDHGTDDDE